MPKSSNHKIALLYMMKELLEKTDEDHTLNATQLIEAMAAYGYEMDRRTVYSNVAILNDFGIEVMKKEDVSGGYYVASRDFELPELKLLVDAVQSSKFISVKRSEELIKKLMQLTSSARAKELNRTVYVRNRVKAFNEKIYYHVDAIYEAINHDRQIEFQYGEWNVAKRLVARKDGRLYRVSPWAITWDDENYYLISHDEDDNRIKHFRVDKMLKVDTLELKRSGRKEFREFDLAAFSKKTFGMYGGYDALVTLRIVNPLIGIIIDRFGKDVMIIPDGKEHCKARATVAVSPQFFGWLAGIGDEIELLSPPEVRKEYKSYLKKILKAY